LPAAADSQTRQWRQRVGRNTATVTTLAALALATSQVARSPQGGETAE